MITIYWYEYRNIRFDTDLDVDSDIAQNDISSARHPVVFFTTELHNHNMFRVVRIL